MGLLSSLEESLMSVGEVSPGGYRTGHGTLLPALFAGFSWLIMLWSVSGAEAWV
jgi:hypothetical protein